MTVGSAQLLRRQVRSLDQEIRAGTGDWRRGRRASQPAAAPGPREPRADAGSRRSPRSSPGGSAATATHARTLARSLSRAHPAQGGRRAGGPAGGRAPVCPELLGATRRGARGRASPPPAPPAPLTTPPSSPLLASHPACQCGCSEAGSSLFSLRLCSLGWGGGAPHPFLVFSSPPQPLPSLLQRLHSLLPAAARLCTTAARGGGWVGGWRGDCASCRGGGAFFPAPSRPPPFSNSFPLLPLPPPRPHLLPPLQGLLTCCAERASERRRHHPGGHHGHVRALGALAAARAMLGVRGERNQRSG